MKEKYKDRHKLKQMKRKHGLLWATYIRTRTGSTAPRACMGLTNLHLHLMSATQDHRNNCYRHTCK